MTSYYYSSHAIVFTRYNTCFNIFNDALLTHSCVFLVNQELHKWLSTLALNAGNSMRAET